LKRNILRVVLLMPLTAILPALAQTNAGAASPAPSQETTLWGLWAVGGWAMYPILILSIVATAFTVYGYINFRETTMVRADLAPGLKSAVQNVDFKSASSICGGNPSTMTRICNAGLMRLSGETLDLRSVEKAMEESSVVEYQAGLKTLNYISVCASLAPMFGLLGTVSGMIKAFQKIGLGAMGDPEMLAANIGEAMITTAYGLIVGIPAMFFYFHLKGQFTSNMAQIGRVLGDLLHEMAESLNQARNGAAPSGAQAGDN
jgi:biopolymer transport protein ExbB